jgi:hypothetical protein
MTKYIIETPNKNYNGVTHGVQFVNGVGETNNENIRNVLVSDFGYDLVNEKQNTEKETKPKKK